MPPKGMRLSRSRQTTPQSPAKSTATRTSQRPTRTATRSQSRDLTRSPEQRKSAKKPLPAVTEEDGSEDEIEVVEVVQPEIPSEVASSSASPDDSAESDSSIDDSSSNGTTQLEALDIDLIVDSLPALYEDASKILSLFDTDLVLDAVRDINILTTKTAKRFRNFSSRFNTSRESYGNGSYISVPLILRKIVDGADVVSGPWRPDSILQLANLSILAANLSQTDNTVLHDTLDRMFNTFPEPFLEPNLQDADASEWFGKFREKTLSFNIALRTQFFLSVVEKSKDSPSFDPDDILKQVFFDEEDNLYGFYQKAEPTPSDIEAAKADEQVILKHLNEIRGFFKKSGKNSIDLARLRKRFPWQRFLPVAFEWIFARKRWLNSRVDSQGGIEAIQDRIEKKNFAPNQRLSIHASPATSTPLNKSINPASEGAQDLQPMSTLSEKEIMAKRVADFQRAKARTTESDEEGNENSDEDGSKDSDDKSSESADGEGNEDSDEESSEHEADRHKSQHTPLPHRSPLKDTGDRQRSVVSEIPQSPDVAAADDDDGIVIGPGDDVVDVGETTPRRATSKQQSKRKSSPPRPTQSSIVPTQQTRAVLEVARQQAALGNKENIDTSRRGFNTKQPSATRLEWNESQTGQKRPYSQVDEGDDDDDDGESDEFETDQRPQKRKRMPRRQPESAVEEWIDGDDEDAEVQDAASEQLQGGDDLPKRDQPPPSAQPRSQKSPLRNRHRETSSRPPASSAPALDTGITQSQNSSQRESRDRSLPPATQAEQINLQAKATMRLRPLLTPGSYNREPQVRRAWEPEEINRLYDMLEQHGCAWSRILTEDAGHPDGPRLQRRSQVQLKDKARNLKMDYLKANEALPAGFRGVTIKKADKEMLASLGMPWE